jgi:Rrf2 family protein
MNSLNMSHAANLAIHALAVLKTLPKGERLSVTKLAIILNVSKSHLAKVMMKLAKAGYVNSITGSKGGFSLVKDPKEISLYMISTLIDGERQTDRCLFNHQRCSSNSCIVSSFEEEIQTKVIEKLKVTTISNFDFKMDEIQS